MKVFQCKMFAILCYLLLTGCAIASWASSYDYSASVQCLEEPLAPQYDGGKIGNPNFNSGLDEWRNFGNGKITLRTSKAGNNYMVAYDRKVPSDSFSHLFYLQKDLLYTFSAWLQVNKGEDVVSAYVFLPDKRSIIVGSVVAKSGCWSMLQGGFTVDENMKAHLYFVGHTAEVELWIDNASLKPFTKTEWQVQQNKSIDKYRKRTIRIHVTSQEGLKLRGAKVIINQTRPHFLVGCGTTSSIITNKAYQDWFAQRFTAATFNNEMKWYYTETWPGNENYTVPDAMVSFFKQNRISIRGHTIVWANAKENQWWLKLLPPKQILSAAIRHVGSVVSRYSDDVIAWDVVNENLHYDFYDKNIGENSSGMFYQIVRALDRDTPLFLNEYNTLEYPMDMQVIPSRYVEKVREMRAFPGNEKMALRIGLQGHFILRPNVSHMRAVLDVLGAMNMPIWLTELDTKRGPQQAAHLEEVMREAFAHPAVEGMIVWGGWKPTGCNETCLSDKNYDVLPRGCAQMCLTDNNFTNLPTGDVVDKLIEEWKTTNVTGVTDKDGVFEQKVFHGEYTLTYSHPLIPRPVQTTFNVTKEKGPLDLWVSL